MLWYGTKLNGVLVSVSRHQHGKPRTLYLTPHPIILAVPMQTIKTTLLTMVNGYSTICDTQTYTGLVKAVHI